MQNSKTYFLFPIIAAALLGACQSSSSVAERPSEYAQAERATEAYALGGGDTIRVTVFGQPDLSGEFEIDGLGFISMPLIGQISAINRSTPALEKEISDKLSDGFLLNPKVSAEVTTYRPFYILGEVSRPGEYPYASGLSVLNAVASAGGFSYRANKRTVFIKSVDENSELPYQMTSQIMVQPGDTIRIGERIF